MTALRVLFGVIVLTIVVMLNTVVVMWCERKWLGHLQSRQGPMRTGWHGVIQPFADAIKLLGKEDLVPAGADRLLFMIAPLIAFAPSVMVYAASPWVQEIAGVESDAGIFMVFAIAALFPVGMLVAGWSSHNKYSLIGGFRAAAQQISYEVPMIMAVLGVVMAAGATSLRGIENAQSAIWNVATQPLTFILFFIGMLAELNRTPFDVPEAESELVGGFNTEYSSMRFALFFVAEYVNVFTWSLLTVLLFFGGGKGPVLPELVWLTAKTYAVVFLIIWVRATLPRIRADQLMALGWKVLLPAALLNVMLTAVGAVSGTVTLVVLEFAAAAVFVWVIARLGARVGEVARQRGADAVRADLAGMRLPRTTGARSEGGAS